MMYSEFTSSRLVADKVRTQQERIAHAQIVKEALAGKPGFFAKAIARAAKWLHSSPRPLKPAAYAHR